MTNEKQLEAAAHKAVTDFVNAQNCQNKGEVVEALVVLRDMVGSALLTVVHGTMEKLS